MGSIRHVFPQPSCASAMNSVNPVVIGLRVRKARDALGLTQEELSKRMCWDSRQTLSDVENGKRAVSEDELERFSEELDQDFEYFIDPFSVVGEAQYSWRASKDVSEDALNTFEMRAAGWVGLLRWLRAQSPSEPSSLRYSLGLDINSTYEQAQRIAESLVAQFDLGPVPADKLAKFVEKELDIPVLFVDMDRDLPQGTISGAACRLPELGVILVNRRESQARRNFDLAHELFHSLTWERMAPQRRESNSPGARAEKRSVRIEQLADNFAAALLMPATTLDVLIDPSRKRNAEHLAETARQLRVSTDALGWRLKALGRIDEPTRLQLASVKRSDASSEVPKQFSAPFAKDLHVALERGRLTVRKAASALGVTLSELAKLFEAYQLGDPSKS